MADSNYEVARAFVTLIPSFEGAQGKISEQLIPRDKILPGSEKAATEAGSRFSKVFSNKLSAAGIAAGAMLGTALVSGIGTAFEGDAALRKLTAQLDLTAEESQKAGDVAGKLYASAYGESLADVTDATSIVISSMDGMRDASSADLEQVTGYAMNLAEVFDVDIAEATSTAGILMKTGLADNAVEAMDLITGSMQQVPAQFRSELFPVMTEYSGYFAQLGLDGEAAMGMIVAAADQGAIGMDKTGDALKEFTIRATDMSSTTTGVYDALGLSTEEMTTKLLTGGEQGAQAMGQIITALQNVKDPGEQAAYAIGLFGTPLEDIGTDKIPAFLDALASGSTGMGDFAGASQAMADTVRSGPANAMEQAKRSFENLALSAAETLMPAFVAVTDWFTANQWAFTALATVIGGVLVGAFVAWTASVIAANAALLANPVTWVVAGIVAAVAVLVAVLVAAITLIVQNWEAIKAKTIEVWTTIQTWFSSKMQSIVAAVGGFVSLVVGGFTNLWSQVKQKVSNGWATVKTFFSTGVSNAVAVVKGLPGKAASALSNLASSLKGKAVDAWNQLKSATSTGISNAVDLVRGLPGKALDALGNLGSYLKNSGAALINGFKDGITGAFNKVKDAVSGGLKKIRSFFPFSPAKEGPFSGKGWVLYSGLSIGDAMAEGIRKSAPQAVAEAESLVALSQEALAEISTPAVRVNRQSASISDSLDAMTTGRRQMTLVVGGREFPAYMEEIADGRIASNPGVGYANDLVNNYGRYSAQLGR